MTYQQAYDKIIQAYFKDEIKPGIATFCFCGTLCDHTIEWFGSQLNAKHYSSHGYTGDDFVRMENALFHNNPFFYDFHRERDDDYEDLLFLGMSAALDVLKQIHIERGEVINEAPVFHKRSLA